MDNISEFRLSLVHPALSDRAHNLADALVAEGYTPRITRGLSTVAAQNALWQIGRDAAGNIVEPSKVVTNAKGTQSNHVCGYACDWCFMNPDGSVNWMSPGFDRLVALAPSYGLRSGAAWHDRPHTELVEFPPEPTAEMQAVYTDEGVAGLWEQFPLPA